MSADNADAGTPLTREGVLAELGFLATVEHALCVEYLLINYALSHSDRIVDTPGTQQHDVTDAAGIAFALAKQEMRFLHSANSGLCAAGRPAQVGRATSIGLDSDEDIALVPASPAEAGDFLTRAKRIAAAVDKRYARLGPAVTSRTPLFDDDAMRSALDPAPDHVTPLGDLAAKLDGIAPAVYLRTKRHEPANESERSLRGVSDQWYQLIVATVEAWFAHETDLGGVLSGRAQALMDGLGEINALLVNDGLLPTFALSR